MNLSTKQKQIHRQIEQSCGCQGGRGGEWDGQGVGVGRYKLLHLERISDEILLYSTWNYIQSPGEEHDGR